MGLADQNVEVSTLLDQQFASNRVLLLENGKEEGTGVNCDELHLLAKAMAR